MDVMHGRISRWEGYCGGLGVALGVITGSPLEGAPITGGFDRQKGVRPRDDGGRDWSGAP